MKRGIKIFLCVTAMVVLLAAVMAGGLLYTTKYKRTDVAEAVSPDKRCLLTLQMRGEPEWPFGSTYGTIIMEYDGEIIQKKDIVIRDDGAMLREDNWEISWGLKGVQVTLSGSEQEDEVLSLMYDGTEFTGYEEAEVTEEMRKRYGEEVCLVEWQDDSSLYQTPEFSFRVQNDIVLTDYYETARFQYETISYFTSTTNRSCVFEERQVNGKSCEIPVISLHSSQDNEKEWFCQSVADWLLHIGELFPYAENEELYAAAGISYGGETYLYTLHGEAFEQEKRTETYNELYDFVESICVQKYESEAGTTEEVKKTEAGKTESTDEAMDITEEILQYWLEIEPSCSYVTEDGMEYRMVPVDRALGSSYYVLLGTKDGGVSGSIVNADPYLGSGGEAMWLTFLEDRKTGFSCLAYSGGAYGALYRTEDGGETFTNIEYPSAKVKLPDGTYYNPFVMPEKVYEENGKLYLEAGQGPDGDYYGENGFCAGLYESCDGGKVWEYIGEITAK